MPTVTELSPESTIQPAETGNVRARPSSGSTGIISAPSSATVVSEVPVVVSVVPSVVDGASVVTVVSDGAVVGAVVASVSSTDVVGDESLHAARRAMTAKRAAALGTARRVRISLNSDNVRQRQGGNSHGTRSRAYRLCWSAYVPMRHRRRLPIRDGSTETG